MRHIEQVANDFDWNGRGKILNQIAFLLVFHFV